MGVQVFSLEGILDAVPGLQTLYKATCPFMYFRNEANDAVESLATHDVFLSEIPFELEEEKTWRKYPTFPHPPLLVAVGTCDAVVVRWRSFETLLWPVERFVLQRYPGRENKPQWSTLLDKNTSEFVDLDVQCGRRYGYRIQALSRDNAASAFEYQWTKLDRVKIDSRTLCRLSTTLLDSAETFKLEGLRSLWLIVACFLTVYGIMRASVVGVQGTESRSSRLKRIKKSSEGATFVVNTSVLPRQSSVSMSSTSPSMAVVPGQRGSMVDASPSIPTDTTGGLMRGHSSIDSMVPLESAHTSSPSTFRPMSRSIGVVDEIATGCEHCGKRFGLFRRRHICDICHSVSLCRKCGYQATVDSFANAGTDTQTNFWIGNDRASTGCRGMDRGRSSLGQQHQKKLKIRTICRNCCDEVYRYSTHASVRPSYILPEIPAQRL
ncbi:unnamed protein product [Peronospora belbahrii]|uniref:Fibronectin type-III domain-containing protein n=1 Tax=Peronospora belbahrii TaxID=622444 RepID=A0AAU9L3W4_9STRA|nr:unnamed protein product [Peronospora belbahrii]CAH0516965.1 unnamed protein product [Peronospora belbahrii]